jgi:C-terminal processing protease CtpA/Prc
MLAVQEWLTPDKRSFWHRGIEPDVKVALPPQTAALRPLAEKELTTQQLRDSGDAQLLKAIAVLSSAPAAAEK